MMTDFSKLHSAMGHNADARDIVKHYAKNRMPENEVKKLKLNEAAPMPYGAFLLTAKTLGHDILVGQMLAKWLTN